VAYGARLEIVLGVKTLAGSNPASSASYQHKAGRCDHAVTAFLRLGDAIVARIETLKTGSED
jgi:hypothetical protein